MAENQTESITNNNGSFTLFPFYDRKQPVFVLVLLGIIFYCTSLKNEYALDDGIIIHQNDYVLKGIKGIGQILGSDSYDAFYKRMNATDQLQGGRYRPLSTISFAIEQELIGTYRTGRYLQVEDLNHNGKLDADPVTYLTKKPDRLVGHRPAGDSSARVAVSNFEYNNFVDLNTDGVAQPEECYNCWDRNMNFRNDPDEDYNVDGIFNEVDCQTYGSFIRHFNNMLFYILACVLLYILFRDHLMKKTDMAFLAALIFLAHPLHSSVVANVKHRDEIFSLIFIVLSLLYAFKSIGNQRPIHMVMSGVFLFLGLMSKEYAILTFVLVPLALYTFSRREWAWKAVLLPTALFAGTVWLMIVLDMNSLYFGWPPPLVFLACFLSYLTVNLLLFRRAWLTNDIQGLMLWLYGFGVLYLVLRLNAVNTAPGVPDTEILNNPYLIAGNGEKFATKIFVLLKALGLMVFPHPLISDYSYASIRYRQLHDWDFLLSAAVYLSLTVAGIWLTYKRHLIGFAILTYLLFVVMVSNLVFSIGAVLVEGCLFHASIGFAIAFAWLIITALNKWPSTTLPVKRTVLHCFVLVLLLLYGCKTWERNWDWKNDVTLFLKDVKNQPHSVLVLGNAGARWIDLADTKEITGVPYSNGYQAPFNDYNGQLHITDEEVNAGGYTSKKEAALQKGISYLKHAVQLHPRYVNGYLNLGLAYFKLNREMDAIFYWKVAQHYYPENPYLSNYYRVYTGILKSRGLQAVDNRQWHAAVEDFRKWTVVEPHNADAWYNLGQVYFGTGQYILARQYWQQALRLKPGDAAIIARLQDLPK